MRASRAEAADEARQVDVAVVVVLAAGDACAAVVEVDEVLVVLAEVAVDEVLDLDEAVDAAGDGDGSLVPEAVLPLRLLEQRPEERVLEVSQRHGEPPLLLALRTDPDRHAPLGCHHLRPVRHRKRAARIEQDSVRGEGEKIEELEGAS